MPTGGSGYTCAGELPSKYVVHTVGPVYHMHEPHEAEALLQSALVSTLEMAKYLGAESVSIPAISSGIFGFPKDKCAEIMLVNSIKWAARGAGSVQKIRMCNFDAPTVVVFQKALKAL